MLFIESLFGLSPDNGSGSLEFLLLLAPLAALAPYRLFRARTSHPRLRKRK